MIMPRGQPLLLPVNPGFIAITLLLALMVNLLPLGRGVWMPDTLLVVLAIWGVREPQRVGMGWAFVLGLCMDVHQASLLGQHAIVYALVMFGVGLLRRRMGWLNLLEQAVQMLPLFVAADVLQLLMRMLMRGGFPGWGALTPGLWEALLWPILGWLLLLPQRQPLERDDNRPL